MKIRVFRNMLFILGFIFILSINLFKLRYGSGELDEAFYLSIPRRIIVGDVLLINEWYPTQLAGLLLVPIVKAHDMLFSDNESIILHFRYVYLLILL